MCTHILTVITVPVGADIKTYKGCSSVSLTTCFLHVKHKFIDEDSLLDKMVYPHHSWSALDDPTSTRGGTLLRGTHVHKADILLNFQHGRQGDDAV